MHVNAYRSLVSRHLSKRIISEPDSHYFFIFFLEGGGGLGVDVLREMCAD